MAKIALLATQDLESPGGLGRHFPFASELSRRGHEVIFLALHPDIENLSQRKFSCQNVQIRYIGPMHVRKSGGEKSYYPIWKLVWIVIQATIKYLFITIRIKPDLIIVLKAQPMNSLSGWLAARILRVPVVLDCDDVEATSNNARKWQRSILAYFEERFARHFDQITTNTQYIRQKLIHLGFQPERITFIPNGVSPERFMVDPESIAALREQLKLGDQLVIGYIGSLALSSHPIDLLLKAFRIVLNDFPNACLLIVGGGESGDQLQTMANGLGIANRTLFVGRISPDQVGAYYHVCNVLVDPVVDDETAAGRCPLKLFESWYCGIPFVTSAVGDRGELLGNPPAGLLAKPGDAPDLAKTLKRILSDPELASDLSTRGFEQVKGYTWDVLGEKLAQVVNHLLSAC